MTPSKLRPRRGYICAPLPNPRQSRNWDPAKLRAPKGRSRSASPAKLHCMGPPRKPDPAMRRKQSSYPSRRPTKVIEEAGGPGAKLGIASAQRGQHPGQRPFSAIEPGQSRFHPKQSPSALEHAVKTIMSWSRLRPYWRLKGAVKSRRAHRGYNPSPSKGAVKP